MRGLRRLGVDVLVPAQTDADRVECDLVDGVSPGEAWRVISEARGFPVPDTGEQEERLAGWREGRFHVKP